MNTVRNIDMCCCGWIGEDFQAHHKNTELEDTVHIETSPLMQIALFGKK